MRSSEIHGADRSDVAGVAGDQTVDPHQRPGRRAAVFELA